MKYFVTIWLPIISIIFSSISLILSLYNLWKNLMHIKLEIKNISSFIDEEHQFLMIDLIINNNSQNNITINNITAFLNKTSYTNFANKINLGRTGFKLGDEELIWEKSTIGTPIKLTSYDSIAGTLLFLIPKNDYIPNKIRLSFNTSRGKKHKTVKYQSIVINDK